PLGAVVRGADLPLALVLRLDGGVLAQQAGERLGRGGVRRLLDDRDADLAAGGDVFHGEVPSRACDFGPAARRQPPGESSRVLCRQSPHRSSARRIHGSGRPMSQTTTSPTRDRPDDEAKPVLPATNVTVTSATTVGSAG